MLRCDEHRPCDVTSSDDNEHNASNPFLLLFADALIVPVLLTGLSDVDELMNALDCRFAFAFTISQQDRALHVPTPLMHDPDFALTLGAVTLVGSANTGGRVSFRSLLSQLSVTASSRHSVHPLSSRLITHAEK